MVRLISDIDKGAEVEDILRDRFKLTKKDISRNNKEIKRTNSGGTNPIEVRTFTGAITAYDIDTNEEQ